jgi:autotransporter-associated beta strand protein
VQKIGTGALELSGTNSYSGLTAVGGGNLVLSGQLTTTNFVVVSNTATLELTGHLDVTLLLINSGGTLLGCGLLTGDLVNNGTVLASCGPGANLRVTGNLTNNGTMQFMAGSGLMVGGTLVNNGLIDLLTGAQSLPANFINNGVVIDSTAAAILSMSRSNQMVSVNIMGYAGHGYQLQRASSLSPAQWQNVGPMESGDGSVLTLEDTSATQLQNFYRVWVNP